MKPPPKNTGLPYPDIKERHARDRRLMILENALDFWRIRAFHGNPPLPDVERFLLVLFLSRPAVVLNLLKTNAEYFEAEGFNPSNSNHLGILYERVYAQPEYLMAAIEEKLKAALPSGLPAAFEGANPNPPANPKPESFWRRLGRFFFGV